MQSSKRSLVVCLAGLVLAGTAHPQCKDSGLQQLALTATIGTGVSLAGDGQGAYVDGVNNVAAYAQSAGNLWTSQNLPVRRRPRSLTFNLTNPAESAPTIGVVTDPRGEVHVFYKLDPAGADGLRLIHSFQEVPANAVPVSSERTEMMVFLNGIRHILVFGGTTWPKNTCAPANGAPLPGPGTTPAWITHTGDTWIVYSEPAGSVGRLYDYTDPFHPADKGLYNFSFYLTFQKKTKRK